MARCVSKRASWCWDRLSEAGDTLWVTCLQSGTGAAAPCSAPDGAGRCVAVWVTSAHPVLLGRGPVSNKQTQAAGKLQAFRESQEGEGTKAVTVMYRPRRENWFPDPRNPSGTECYFTPPAPELTQPDKHCQSLMRLCQSLGTTARVSAMICKPQPWPWAVKDPAEEPQEPWHSSALVG